LNQIPVSAFILTDKGYQGVYALHPNIMLPLKAKRRCKLDPELIIRQSTKEESGLSMYSVALKPLRSLLNVTEIEAKDSV